jgi:hypothetical protein
MQQRRVSHGAAGLQEVSDGHWLQGDQVLFAIHCRYHATEGWIMASGIKHDSEVPAKEAGTEFCAASPASSMQTAMV